jgi:hypothetical protein
LIIKVVARDGFEPPIPIRQSRNRHFIVDSDTDKFL